VITFLLCDLSCVRKTERNGHACSRYTDNHRNTAVSSAENIITHVVLQYTFSLETHLDGRGGAGIDHSPGGEVGEVDVEHLGGEGHRARGAHVGLNHLELVSSSVEHLQIGDWRKSCDIPSITCK